MYVCNVNATYLYVYASIYIYIDTGPGKAVYTGRAVYWILWAGWNNTI